MESDLRNGWQAFPGPQNYFLSSRKIGIRLKKGIRRGCGSRSQGRLEKRQTGTHQPLCLQTCWVAGRGKAPVTGEIPVNFASVRKQKKKSQCSLGVASTEHHPNACWARQCGIGWTSSPRGCARGPQAWQEGENHKADCQLTDITVDFSSFVSYKITAMSPDSLADNIYFQRCLEGIRKRGLEVLWR